MMMIKRQYAERKRVRDGVLAYATKSSYIVYYYNVNSTSWSIKYQLIFVCNFVKG